MQLCWLPHSILPEEKPSISACTPHLNMACSYFYDRVVFIFLLLQRWYCRSPDMLHNQQWSVLGPAELF